MRYTPGMILKCMSDIGYIVVGDKVIIKDICSEGCCVNVMAIGDQNTHVFNKAMLKAHFSIIEY
jgi:hypothetical protein